MLALKADGNGEIVCPSVVVYQISVLEIFEGSEVSSPFSVEGLSFDPEHPNYCKRTMQQETKNMFIFIRIIG
jgi:hypothetical protein